MHFCSEVTALRNQPLRMESKRRRDSLAEGPLAGTAADFFVACASPE